MNMFGVPKYTYQHGQWLVAAQFPQTPQDDVHNYVARILRELLALRRPDERMRPGSGLTSR
jgi:hypothetical protein